MALEPTDAPAPGCLSNTTARPGGEVATRATANRRELHELCGSSMARHQRCREGGPCGGHGPEGNMRILDDQSEAGDGRAPPHRLVNGPVTRGQRGPAYSATSV